MPEELPPTEVDRLLRYAELTYRAVIDRQRRLATVAGVFAAVFAAVTLFAGFQWWSLRAQVDDIPDEALVEALGVRIPDPRPAIERGELRLKAFVWLVVSIGALVWTLLALGVRQLVRPPKVQPEQALGRSPPSGAQPPM